MMKQLYSKEDIAESVAEAFANAADNGFSFREATVEEIVTDMMTHDADIEQMPVDGVTEAVRAHLEAWKNERT